MNDADWTTGTNPAQWTASAVGRTEQVQGLMEADEDIKQRDGIVSNIGKKPLGPHPKIGVQVYGCTI